MNKFWWQHWLNPSLCLYPLGLLLLHSFLPLCYGSPSMWENTPVTKGRGEDSKFCFVFSWISSSNHFTTWQHTCWWWCRAGGSSEKGKELRATYNILNNHAAECGTRAWIGITHRKVRKCPIVNTETSNSMDVKSDTISFQAAIQTSWTYFIHYVNYDI